MHGVCVLRVFDRRGSLWIRLRSDASRIHRYNVHSRVRSGKVYDIGTCLLRGWDNELPVVLPKIHLRDVQPVVVRELAFPDVYIRYWRCFPHVSFRITQFRGSLPTSPCSDPHTYLLYNGRGKFAQCRPRRGGCRNSSGSHGQDGIVDHQYSRANDFIENS